MLLLPVSIWILWMLQRREPSLALYSTWCISIRSLSILIMFSVESLLQFESETAQRVKIRHCSTREAWGFVVVSSYETWLCSWDLLITFPDSGVEWNGIFIFRHSLKLYICLSIKAEFQSSMTCNYRKTELQGISWGHVFKGSVSKT